MAGRTKASPKREGAAHPREQHVREEFWRAAKRVASNIPFAEELLAAYYCALDKDTPFRVKGILLAALAYFILPVDVIPDFLLAFGFTDDIAVLTAAITSVSANLKPAHRKAARKALAEA